MDEGFCLKILIIRLSALGDTIHTLPLVSALKEKYPNCEIGWVVEDKAKQFVVNNPLVDNAFVIPKKNWKNRGFSFRNIREFFSIISEINAHHYDIVIDTQQLIKSAVIMAFLNIKRKITLNDGREFSCVFANEIIKTQRKQFDVNYHVVRRNLEFAKYLGANSDEVNFVLPPSSEEVMAKVTELLSPLDSRKKTVVIAPATTWKNKHWKKENWCEVVNNLKLDVNFILTATNADKDLADFILKNTNKEVLDLCGKTNLEELTEVIKRADLVISPDSGTAHIAWATGNPSVITIFCATSPNRTGPFGKKYISIGPEIDCAPCMKKKCKLKLHNIPCTESIISDNIINIVNNLLQ